MGSKSRERLAVQPHGESIKTMASETQRLCVTTQECRHQHMLCTHHVVLLG